MALKATKCLALVKPGFTELSLDELATIATCINDMSSILHTAEAFTKGRLMLKELSYAFNNAEAAKTPSSCGSPLGYESSDEEKEEKK